MGEHGKHRPLVGKAARRALAAAFWLAAAGAAPAACRQALAIGMDVSRSVDRHEYALQVGGLAQALADAGVRAAILDAPGAPVAIAVFDWSSEGDQRLIVPWTVVTGPAVLDDIAGRVLAMPKPADAGMTGVGAAVRFGMGLLTQQRACARLTLDLSGDGMNNSGPMPDQVETSVAGRAVTVNGLAVGSPRAAGTVSLDPDLESLTAWYEAEVMRGPGSFVERAVTYSNFASAMRRKLERELQPPLARLALPRRTVPG